MRPLPLAGYLHYAHADAPAEHRWVIGVTTHDDGRLFLRTGDTFDLRVEITMDKIMARPPRRLADGPVKEALRDISVALGRAAAERRFGFPTPATRMTPINRTLRGQP